MALAQASDVAARLRRALTESEGLWVPGLIDEASDLVIGYLGCDPTVDGVVPPEVARLVSRMVARVILQDQSEVTPGVTQVGMTAGPYSEQRTFREGAGSGSPWLEQTDKVRLRPFRCGGGMLSVPLSSEQSGRYRQYP